MTFEQLALAASVVCAGLWSGLLGMLTLVVHPMLAPMNGAAFGVGGTSALRPSEQRDPDTLPRKCAGLCCGSMPHS
jgi:hypothetical protein